MNNRITGRHILTAILTVFFASQTHADVVSTFDFDTDGWIKNPDGDAATTLSWVATGGNPGGALLMVDGAQGKADSYLAPAKFLGDDSIYYNGTLQFDFYEDADSIDFNFGAVLTDATGHSLSHSLGTFFTRTWTTFSFPLNENSGWTYFDGATNSVATQAEFQSVLSDVTFLQIPADLHANNESNLLDNVALTVPEPCSTTLAGCGLAALAVTQRRRRACSDST